MASRSHGTSAHDEDCVCTRCVGIKAGKAPALRHGSYPSISAKRAAQLAAEVRETAPVYEDADEPVVRLLALTLARVEVATKAIGQVTASYGLILRNRSYGKDAVNIDVRVSALDALGRTAADDDEYVMLIPAGQSFNVGNELIASVSVKVARLRVSVTVGRRLPKGQRLPSVTGTELSQANNEISGFVRNPYSKSIPDGASIFAVLLNGPGRIVGGFSDWIGARVLPRQSTSYCIYPLYMPGDAASALVSVNPCDDLALVCAIRGAQ